MNGIFSAVEPLENDAILHSVRDKKAEEKKEELIQQKIMNENITKKL